MKFPLREVYHSDECRPEHFMNVPNSNFSHMQSNRLIALLGSVILTLTVSLAITVAAVPCPIGLVMRTAAPGDSVCVTPDSRRRAAEDNARTALLWVSGSFGPKTCAMGYVWREAFPGDLTCVTPDVRAETLKENSNPRGGES